MTTPLEIVVYAYFESGFGRDVLQGVMNYARTHRRWMVRPLSVKHRGSVRELKRGGNKGVIVTASVSELAELVCSLGKPAVNVSGQLYKSPMPRVTADNLRAGQQAAKHLLDFGVRSFGFVADPHRAGLHHDLRHAGFVQAVEKAGHECQIFSTESASRRRTSSAAHNRKQPFDDAGPAYRRSPRFAQRLRRWLTALPWGTGVLASSASTAVEILAICRESQIVVPDQLLVVGVDHDPLQNMLAGVPLSSVDVNGTLIGYEAAKLLDRMLQGEQIPPGTELTVEPTGVITGATTDYVSEADEHVAVIRRYIRYNLDQPLSVSELTNQVPLCRRALEKRFRQVVGRSPSAEIRRLRIEAAKELLARTNLAVGTIAIELGFGELKRLSAIFRREVGCTPTEFRATAQERQGKGRPAEFADIGNLI